MTIIRSKITAVDSKNMLVLQWMMRSVFPMFEGNILLRRKNHKLRTFLTLDKYFGMYVKILICNNKPLFSGVSKECEFWSCELRVPTGKMGWYR